MNTNVLRERIYQFEAATDRPDRSYRVQESINSQAISLIGDTLQLFYDEVCKRAEAKMLTTGKLEGAHYASMTAVLREWKEELEKE